jgi:hypothetical protein
MQTAPLARVVVASLLGLGLAAPVAAGVGTQVGSFAAVDRPAIAIHGGATFIAAAGGPGVRGIHLLMRSGGAWNDIGFTTQLDRQPSMAIRSDGVIYLAFSRRTTGCATPPCTTGIYSATNATGSWVISLVHAGAKDVHPSIAIDQHGKPWIQFRVHQQIVEARRSHGSWTALSVADGGCCDPDPLAGPELAIQGQRRYSVFRRQQDGGEIRLRYVEAGLGANAATIETADDASDPDLALSPDTPSTFYVAYRRTGDGLWYAHGNNATATTREQLTGEEVGPPAIATLPGGKVLTVAQTESGIIYRTNATGVWTGGGLTSTGGDAWPAVATTGAGAGRIAFLHPGSTEGLNVWLVHH